MHHTLDLPHVPRHSIEDSRSSQRAGSAAFESGSDAECPAIRGRVEGYVAISEGPDRLVYDPVPRAGRYEHGAACAGIIRAWALDREPYGICTLNAALSGHGTVFAAGLPWAVRSGKE